MNNSDESFLSFFFLSSLKTKNWNNTGINPVIISILINLLFQKMSFKTNLFLRVNPNGQFYGHTYVNDCIFVNIRITLFFLSWYKKSIINWYPLWYSRMIMEILNKKTVMLSFFLNRSAYGDMITWSDNSVYSPIMNQ